MAHFTGRISGMRFTKMHGLGNDFIIFDAPPGGAPDSEAIRRLADRFTGIGFDQALMLEPPRAAGYRRVLPDLQRRRPRGRTVRQRRALHRALPARASGHAAGEIVLDSPGGLVQTRTQGDRYPSTMGVPDFEPASLPFEASGEAYVYPLSVGASEVEVGAISIGNPHAVIRVPSVAEAPVARLGPAIEHHPRFPNRTNVGFMELAGPRPYPPAGARARHGRDPGLRHRRLRRGRRRPPARPARRICTGRPSGRSARHTMGRPG